MAKDKSSRVKERYWREPIVLQKRVTSGNNSPSNAVSDFELDMGEEIGLA